MAIATREPSVTIARQPCSSRFEGADTAERVDGVEGRDPVALTSYGSMQALSVPGYYAVGHAGQDARGGDEILRAPAALRGTSLAG